MSGKYSNPNRRVERCLAVHVSNQLENCQHITGDAPPIREPCLIEHATVMMSNRRRKISESSFGLLLNSSTRRFASGANWSDDLQWWMEAVRRRRMTVKEDSGSSHER